MKGHTKPRCLKSGAGRVPREARIRRVYLTVKRVGEMSELSTINNGCTAKLTSSAPDIRRAHSTASRRFMMDLLFAPPAVSLLPALHLMLRQGVYVGTLTQPSIRLPGFLAIQAMHRLPRPSDESVPAVCPSSSVSS